MRGDKFEKLRKKSIWPSIVLFVGFLASCIIIVGLFIQLFATYIMANKITQLYEENRYIGGMLDEFSKNRSISDAMSYAALLLPADRNLYAIDQDRNKAAQVGNSEPDFGLRIEISLEEDMVVLADREESNQFEDGVNTVFAMPMKEVFAAAFRYAPMEGHKREWLSEPLLRQHVWLKLPFKNPGYQVYVRCLVEIARQDVLYVGVFGAIAFILLLIPSTFLFINTIRSIVNQRRVTQLVYLDTVTGGRNWFYLRNRAVRILTKRRNSRKTYAMVNIHFERYQNYCACYGVKEGEDLLSGIDGFLKARTDRDEIFARYEGADFGVLLCCMGITPAQMQQNCQKRVRSILAELTGLKPEHKIHFHAGVYMIYPELTENKNKYCVRKSVDVNQMYHYANAARVSTKCQEQQRISFFNQDILSAQLWERTVEDTMEEALYNEEFHVYLQPKYSPADARLVGAEALVRWISPEKGLIPPGRFIPIFERNGFITQLDDYMISHVAKLQAEWTIQGKKQVPISINVSRAHFSQEGLAEHICRLVDAYGPKHELIELEVTESAFFDDKDILVTTVKQLKAYGFHVSMDDFGAGYSSLNSLKDIPLDVLKLDGEFFRGEDDDGRGEVIVKEAIQLAKSLDMRVVAEGVEKKEQVDFLAKQGCDMIQGYYFAKPMPVNEFVEKVEMDA